MEIIQLNKIMYKHDEQIDKRKINLISFISFLMGFIQALFIYVISTYFKEASGTENIGPFYLITYGIVLLAFFNLHKVFRILGKSNVFLFTLIFKIVSITLLIILPPSSLAVAVLMAYIFFSCIEWVSMDVILEAFSIDNMSGRIRGKHLTVLNLGFLLGPIISTQIVGKFGFEGIFFILFFANSFMFLISLLGLRNVNHRFEDKVGFLELIKKVRKRKNILRIYWISFALDFFYALAIIYTPIYLLDLGFSWANIGWIFTAMLLPFVLLQYPVGILADKKMGEKELIIVSLFFLAFFTGVIYFIGSSTSILIWALVLFATRIGAAILEIMRDSYFYKRIDGHDVDLIDFFRTTQATSYIFSAIIAFAIFRIFPVNPIRIIFAVIVVVILLVLFPALRLEDNKCEKEMAK